MSTRRYIELGSIKDGATRRSLERLGDGLNNRVGAIYSYSSQPIPSGGISNPTWLGVNFPDVIAPDGWFNRVDLGGSTAQIFEAPYDGLWQLRLDIELETDGPDRLWRAVLQAPWDGGSPWVWGGGTQSVGSVIWDSADRVVYAVKGADLIPGISCANGGTDATLHYFRMSYEYLGHPTDMGDGKPPIF